MANPSLLICGGAAAAVLLLARRRARAWSRPLRCTFRPATAEDVESIARCWAEAYPDQGPDLQTLDPSFLAERTGAHMFRSRARERTADTLVACDSHGAVVGFCVCVGAGDTAEIEQLFLCARARGTDVAVSLLQRGEELLRARGSAHAHLYCFPKNEAARSLQTLTLTRTRSRSRTLTLTRSQALRCQCALRFYERCGWRRRGGVHQHDVQISGGRTFTLQARVRSRMARVRVATAVATTIRTLSVARAATNPSPSPNQASSRAWRSRCCPPRRGSSCSRAVAASASRRLEP